MPQSLANSPAQPRAKPATPRKKAAKAAPPKGPKKSELTRARLLDAAAHVFREKGYALTRLSDIAKRAKTPVSAIYYYFASRDEIVVRVLEIANERTAQRVHGAVAELPSDASIEQKMSAAVRAHCDIVLLADPYARAHMKIFDQLPAPIQKKFRMMLDKTSDIWRVLLAEGQATGAIREDMDLSVVRQLLLGMINWSVEWYQPDGRLSIDEIAQQTSSLLFQGIAAAGRKPSKPKPVKTARPVKAVRT